MPNTYPLGSNFYPVDNAILRINLYPPDSAIGFPADTNPLDSDLSGGWRFPVFEWLRRYVHLVEHTSGLPNLLTDPPIPKMSY